MGWPGSNGNEGALLIPQCSGTRASLSYGLVLNLGNSLGEWFYTLAEMQPVYSVPGYV